MASNASELISKHIIHQLWVYQAKHNIFFMLAHNCSIFTVNRTKKKAALFSHPKLFLKKCTHKVNDIILNV